MSNKLTLTQAALSAPQNLKGVFEIEAFKENFVNNYLKTTGKTDGSLVYEREKILFMKAIQSNPKLEKCDRFTIYAAFIELAASGLTLGDDLAYVIPYGEKAQFQIGWKGRLEQISQMPEVNFVNEPILVYESDDFDYEVKDGKIVIIKHKPNLKRSSDDQVTFVYLSLDTHYGVKVYLMPISDVYSIRDNYATGYKQYVKDVEAKSLKIGESFKKTITPRGGSSFEITVEPPFWVTSPGQAIKKTLVKRVYGTLPKTPRLKALDERIKGNFDKEEAASAETHDIDYGLVEKEDAPKPVEKETVKATIYNELPDLGDLNESY